MTGDDIGLSFFTHHTPPPSGRPSAFGPVDQEALIARMDAVDDDDFDSTFFADSILDVENASTRAFNIGIRVHGTDSAAAQRAELTTAGIDATPAPAADPAEVPVVGQLADDARARRAFILGGPAGLQ